MVAGAGKRAGGGSSRGGIAKRRSAARTDRDGDLVMDSSSKGRGGVAKGAGPGRGGKAARSTRGGLNSATAQRDILRHVSGGEGALRPPRSSQSANRGLEELKITGWTSSKAAANDDGGVTSLITFLEKKATLRTGPSKRPIRIKKSRVEENVLIVSVASQDVVALSRVDGFVFAGANIKIERAGKAAREEESGAKADTVAMLKGVLHRRYNVELKLLDLSSLAQDPDLKASAIFDSRSTTSKFFPALMKVLDQQFKTVAEKHDAIQSVTLANNDLSNVSAVTTLSQTLSQLQNLDLSNNQLADLAAIEVWRTRFAKLDHLVITNNPLEQAVPDYAKTLVNWFPRLRLLNSVQVRSDEEAAKGCQITAADLPFPIRTASFQDDGQIAENFLRTFFTGFDTDRTALANHYYDDQSTFSLSVNTGAPRDPSATAQTAPQEWEQYIKKSRNLKKISQLPVRQTRLSRGPQAVQESWAHVPATRHPDLATAASRWLIECQSQPGVPDPSGQSPVGVDGFLITVHGEYDELDTSTGQSKKTRSFDRSFVIGPGGPTGVRVVSDMLTVRAYGGIQAFEPDNTDSWTANSQPGASAVAQSVPSLPAGLAPEVAEQMLVELQKQTGMTVPFAKDCLEQVQWDFEKALLAFAAVRANLGPEAFVQQS